MKSLSVAVIVSLILLILDLMNLSRGLEYSSLRILDVFLFIPFIRGAMWGLPHLPCSFRYSPATIAVELWAFCTGFFCLVECSVVFFGGPWAKIFFTGGSFLGISFALLLALGGAASHSHIRHPDSIEP